MKGEGRKERKKPMGDMYVMSVALKTLQDNRQSEACLLLLLLLLQSYFVLSQLITSLCLSLLYAGKGCFFFTLFQSC